MNNLFKPVHLNIKDKYRNLEVETSGEVKSTKYFPVYLIGGEEYIFKPLSRTKPYTTPFYAYAEVFWSSIINMFFDSDTPVYKLAYCAGIEAEQPKYYNQGTLVKSTIKGTEKLFNLLEYYREYPDSNVDIDKYINYCMVNYDYSKILESINHRDPELGCKIAFQVLLSMLRQDYNFHYENVNFIMDDGKIKGINPPIDFEFSGMFLFPDNLASHQEHYRSYLYQMRLLSKKEHEIHKFYAETFGDYRYLRSEIISNVCAIVKLYPDLVREFLKKLEGVSEYVKALEITDEEDFIGPLSSESWKIGHSIKEGNLDEANRLELEIKLQTVDKNFIFARIKKETLENASFLERLLKIYLFAHISGVSDLVNLTQEELIEMLKSHDNEQAIELKRLLNIS